MKKILITSTDMMMIQFLIPHVRYLSENGYTVEIACSVVGDRLEDVRRALEDIPCVIHTVRLERSPASPRNFLGYRDMKRLLKKNRYDIIWTNEPVMGVVTRLAARKVRKTGTKVVYMCHGFHFYKGASLANWLIFYPVERLMSRFCDMIVTINREDEARAKTFQCPRVEHIDGSGVDISKRQCTVSRVVKRKEMGIKESDILVLSVGELQTRKNHEVILRAIAQLQNPNIKYFLCGKGVLQDHLEELMKTLGLQDQVRFLGYRKDVPEIMNAADIFAHPSKREGLGLACLEAMASGLPLVTSNIQGIPDYVENGVTGFLCDPEDVEKYAGYLHVLIGDSSLRKRIGETNTVKSSKYAVESIQLAILKTIDQITMGE